MKKLILVALLLGIPSFLAAQITNEGFEKWEARGNQELPVGWNSSGFGVGKADSSYSGEYAVSVWNWYTYALGFVMTDQTRQARSFAMDEGGVPIDYVPEKLIGYYKFDRGGAPDTATATGFAVLMFRRHNPTTGGSDTVSFTRHPLPASEGWQMFEIAIPRPASGVKPDTMVIGFFSTDPTLDHRIQCTVDANECCYLSIDQVALVSSSGVPYPLQSLLAPVQTVPNPVTDGAVLRFEGDPGKSYRVAIYDASGRLAAEREIIGSEVDLSGFDLSAGVYHVSIADLSGTPVASGRFVIE